MLTTTTTTTTITVTRRCTTTANLQLRALHTARCQRQCDTREWASARRRTLLNSGANLPLAHTSYRFFARLQGSATTKYSSCDVARMRVRRCCRVHAQFLVGASAAAAASSTVRRARRLLSTAVLAGFLAGIAARAPRLDLGSRAFQFGQKSFDSIRLDSPI